MKFLASTLALLVLMGGFASAQVRPRADVVYRNTRGDERTETNVQVESYTWSGLVGKFKTGKRTIDIDSLVSVTYRRPPTAFEEGAISFTEGSFNAAIENFLTLLDSDLKDSEIWAEESARYHLWASYRGIGAYEDAKAAAADLQAKFKKSSYLPEVILRSAEDMYAFGEFGPAAAKFGEIADQAKKGKWARRYVARAQLGQVSSLLEDGKTDAASALFDTVAGSVADENLKNQVEVIRGKIMIKKGRVDAARSHYDQLFKKADWKKQPKVFSGAANGLGDCHFEKGDWEKAIFEYSKTFALYSDDMSLENEVGWSMWRFALASKQLAATVKDQEAARTHRVRYERMRRSVARDYRMTRGGQISRRELGIGR